MCPSLDPPLTVECMNKIWLNESCIINGTHYPELLTGPEKDVLNTFNVP